MLNLLPTPTRHMVKDTGAPSEFDRKSPEITATVLQLLPTTAATEYGNNQSPSDGAAVRPSLPALVRLLPTPTEGDSRNSRNATANSGNGSTGNSGTTLSDVAYEWSGATTSPPSNAGKPSTGLRLSPSFVEWMIGAPPGWSDPACPLSATEFSAKSAGSPASTSWVSSGEGSGRLRDV